MCRRCSSPLTPDEGDWRCPICGWVRYSVVKVHRFSQRERETRRRRQLRVFIEAAALARCVACRRPAVTSKFCARHRDRNNAAARARLLARRASGLCRTELESNAKFLRALGRSGS